MSTRALCSSLAIIFAIGAPVAEADTIESLVFTGTAACQSPFEFQECTPGSVGPLTGTYTLDVTTQQIVGPWSFASRFFAGGVTSSSDPGALGVITDGVMNGGISYDVAGFFETTTNQGLTFGFTGATALVELGPISTPTPVEVIISGICQSVPGTSPPGCEPDVNIAGATTLATSSVPEPSSIALIVTAIAFMGTLLWFKRHLAR